MWRIIDDRQLKPQVSPEWHLVTEILLSCKTPANDAKFQLLIQRKCAVCLYFAILGEVLKAYDCGSYEGCDVTLKLC